MQLEGMGDKEVPRTLPKMLAMTWGNYSSGPKGVWLSKKDFIKMGVRECLNANGNDLVEKKILKM